jgi:TolB-like protein
MLTERSLPNRSEIAPMVPSLGEKIPLPPTNSSFGNERRPGARLNALPPRLFTPDWHRHRSTDGRIAEAEAPPGRKEDDAALALDGAIGIPPCNAMVLRQLARILQSRTFVQSEKLSRFLRFVVEHVIDGNPGCLKEYLVGVEVYDRKPPYDPSQDSIVRTEARRLRNKLKEYYGAEGKEDPVYIYLRPGSYVPAFQSRENLAGASGSVEPDALLLQDSSSIVTAILPFMDISGNPISEAYARGVPDELAYALMRKEGCTVISPFSTVCLARQGLDLAATMKKVGAHIAFDGSAKVDGTKLRIIARIVDMAGVQLWVKRVNVEVGIGASFKIEEEIANELSAGFDTLFGSSRHLSIVGGE